MDFTSILQNDVLTELTALVERYEHLEGTICSNNANNEHLQEIYQCMTHLDLIIGLETENSITLLHIRDQMQKQADILKSISQKCASTILMNRPLNETYVENVPKSNNCTEPVNSDKVINNIKTTPKISSLQKIAGLNDIKKELITSTILPMLQPQLFNNFKVTNSILLYGPPGTGKTLIAHALAAEINAEFYSVSASSILSAYVGESERKLKVIFEHATQENKYTLIFIDEIDGLCRERNDSENESSRRLKTEMMCQLNLLENCLNTYLICATNCPWVLDNAFMRRFNKKIYVPLPNHQERFEFLKLYTLSNPLKNTTEYWGSLVNKLEGYSGADIANVIRHALNIPLKELLDVNSWKLINNKYKPAYLCQDLDETVINCSIEKLPKNSVLARDPQYIDLLTAINVVQRSTTDEQIRKYKNYI